MGMRCLKVALIYDQRSFKSDVEVGNATGIVLDILSGNLLVFGLG